MMRKLVTYGFVAAFLAPLSLGVVATDVHAQAMDGFDASASVDVYYGYYFNKVDAQGLRTFDALHNSFTLSLAEFALEKAPTEDSKIGGRIDLDFGPTADIVGSTDFPGTSETFKHVQQAYLSIMASPKLTIDVGKFVTPIGAEVIESQDNWNYTRSILFGYAIPFDHTGVRATLAANDQVSLSGFILNGWNNSIDNNSDKTFAASASIAPSDQLSVIGNFMAGKELDNNGDGTQDLRWLFDGTVSFAATDKVSLMGNFDYGHDANYIATDSAATWWGVAAYARVQANDGFALAGRYEYVDDSNGGWMTIGQKAQSFTITGDHTMDDLTARLEFRLDHLETAGFTKSDGSSTQNQPSLTVGLVWAK
jgi:Putative beta-barrel porin-2, OmpL-like. bbp2